VLLPRESLPTSSVRRSRTWPHRCLITRSRGAVDERTTHVELSPKGRNLRRQALKVPPAMVELLCHSACLNKSEKNWYDGSFASGVPLGVSLVIGWLRSTVDGSFTWAQSVTILRSMNFHVPSRFSYLSR
jgi:hypothetical protein